MGLVWWLRLCAYVSYLDAAASQSACILFANRSSTLCMQNFNVNKTRYTPCAIMYWWFTQSTSWLHWYYEGGGKIYVRVQFSRLVCHAGAATPKLDTAQCGALCTKHRQHRMCQPITIHAANDNQPNCNAFNQQKPSPNAIRQYLSSVSMALPSLQQNWP